MKTRNEVISSILFGGRNDDVNLVDKKLLIFGGDDVTGRLIWFTFHVTVIY